ncbi:MAG: ABC-three component system protein [bacterium]
MNKVEPENNLPKTFESSGVKIVHLSSGWRPNGDLQVCVVKPPMANLDIMDRDLTRPNSVALAQSIILTEGSPSTVRRCFNNLPGLVIFPELAFGSEDFDALDSIIQKHPTPLIILAGFGFCNGTSLKALLDIPHVEAGWDVNEQPPDPDGRYNGGWCWVHERPGATKCYLFLKNFPDPSNEVPFVDNITYGRTILRVEANDLVLFPVICSDLICSQKGSPRDRIQKSLEEEEPTARARVLVAGMLCSPKPEHDFWRLAINDLVGLQNPPAVLFLVNQQVIKPKQDEDCDKWRCLTGAFISRNIMNKAPKIPLPHVRYIKTDAASGLLLRCAEPGVTLGPLRWVDQIDQGKGVWTPNRRYIWRDGELRQVHGNAVAYELNRFLLRRREAIVDNYVPYTEPLSLRSGNDGRKSALDEPNGERNLTLVQELVGKSIDDLQKDIEKELWEDNSEHKLTSTLWPRMLSGGIEKLDRNNDTGLRDPDLQDPDMMHNYAEHFDRALGMVAALKAATPARLDPEKVQQGQLFLNVPEGEILVWKSKRLRSREQYSFLQNIAEQSGSAIPLIVVGAGHGSGPEPPSGRVQIEHRTNIVRPQPSQPNEHLITEPRPRTIYWRCLGELEHHLVTAKNEEQLRVQLTASLLKDFGDSNS